MFKQVKDVLPEVMQLIERRSHMTLAEVNLEEAEAQEKRWRSRIRSQTKEWGADIWKNEAAKWREIVAKEQKRKVGL